MIAPRARHLDALEALQRAAYDAVEGESSARLVGVVAAWLHVIRMRSANRYVDGQAVRVNQRRSVREAARNPFMPPEWFYEGKRKERRLTILLDLSESMEAHLGWMALLTNVLLKAEARLSLYGVTTRVRSLEAGLAGPAAIQRTLARFVERQPACLSVLDLPRILEDVRRLETQSRFLLYVTDGIIPPGALRPDEAWLRRAATLAAGWHGIAVLDPSHLGTGDPETGLLRVTAGELRTLLHPGASSLTTHPVRVRCSETDLYGDTRRILDAHPDTVVGRIHLGHPHLAALARHGSLRNTLFRVIPRATFTDFVSVLQRWWTSYDGSPPARATVR